MAIKTGDKWAALECTDVYKDRVVIELKGGRESYLDWFYDLKCKCGVAEKVLKREFAGKRTKLDCGCGAGKQERENELGCIVTVYMPVGAVTRLREYAREKGLSVSKATVALIDAMLGE